MFQKQLRRALENAEGLLLLLLLLLLTLNHYLVVLRMLTLVMLTLQVQTRGRTDLLSLKQNAELRRAYAQQKEVLTSRGELPGKVDSSDDGHNKQSVQARKPKPFAGQGDMGSAGAVRRSTDSLQLFFQLSDVPKAKWVLHARLYLEGLAADDVNIAMRTMPDSDCSDWPKLCALLSIRFGQIDPDTEFWDQLRDLKQGMLPAAEYVHKMRYCFNGIIELPLSDGEKVERFMSGLNAPLKRLVVTAPLGMGRNGRWLDADELMSYAVLQARALPNAGAASHAVPAVGSVGLKTASAGGQK
ncbi:TPA: hypothetical protein ACH3X2_010540 [Trebouxia sp. C0005]